MRESCEPEKTAKAEFGATAMEKGAGHTVTTSSDAVWTTGASGKCGMGHIRAAMNTKPSRKQWTHATECGKCGECGECGQPLEEWEAGICEGCGMLRTNRG